MDTKKLRQKILDLAIRGKLVPQDSNDEPASVLIEKIRAEKDRLIKEKKIKRDKNESFIYRSDTSYYEQFADGSVKCIDEEIPFEIPESWEWCRLGNVCSIKGGKRIPKGGTFSSVKTEHVYIRVSDMKNNTVLLNGLKYIDNQVYDVIKNYTISKDDLYLTIAGTIGGVGIIPEVLDNMNLTENAAKLTDIKTSKFYLMYSLLSTLAQEQFMSKFHQVAQPKLSIETSSITLIPIPPLEEQQRIVEEIQRLLLSIETLDENKTSLEQFVTQTKSKILDLAIRGKLVPKTQAMNRLPHCSNA